MAILKGVRCQVSGVRFQVSENRCQMTEDRRQRVEDRGQKTVFRRQRTGDRSRVGHRADRYWRARWPALHVNEETIKRDFRKQVSALLTSCKAVSLDGNETLESQSEAIP